MPSFSPKTLAASPTTKTLNLTTLSSLTDAACLHAHLLKSGRLYCRRHSPFLANRLAAAYSRLGAAAAALGLFHGLTTKNCFSYNILLNALLKSGNLRDARKVFDEMPHKDIVSYNSMISGCVANGRVGDALGLLYRMRELGIRPSAFTLSISASSVLSALHGKQVHAVVVRHGLGSSNSVVGNSLVDMYRRVGLLEYATRVFRNLDDPDVISWNTVISVYKDSGQHDRVFECFQSMRNLGFAVDEFSVSTVLSMCANGKDLVKGEQLLALCFKMGFLWNSIVSSAIIDLLCVCDRVADAIQLFEGMARWDSELCNSMISGYARTGLMEEALGLFLMALRNGVLPTEFTFASVLRSSLCFVLTVLGTQIHSLICKLGFEDDVIVSSALIDMYSKLGSTKYAMEIFNRIDAKDLVLWNTMIMGLAHNGRGKEALRMFWQMLESRIQPDRITLLGTLSACSYEGLVDEGKKILSLSKKKYWVVLGLEHYACVVDMLGRAGRFREAIDFIENMLCKPTAAVFGTVLEACMIHGNLDMAELVAEKMMKLEPRSSLPYFVLARMYGARGRWESMARMWRSMEEHRAKKVQGCSWLCIKNHIYVFRSNQILHHGGEATYLALHLLNLEMEDHGYVPECVELIYGHGE